VGIEDIKAEKTTVVGNVFMSVAQMSYLGPFTGPYREAMIGDWIKQSQSGTMSMQLSENYSLVQTLGDAVEIRKWGVCGLPGDLVSIDNAVFTTRSGRVPMLIDPQFQGNSWLKKMFKSTLASEFIVAKFEKSKQDDVGKKGGALQAILEKAVTRGHTLLLEDMSEELDPSVAQVVSQATFTEDGVRKIILGSRTLDYDDNFKVFLTTKMANPHFLPEVSITLAVINFTVTFDGLDE
jgi:dynein heavy chain